jgi:L-ascorbate metabolism protein UlaG (beta-lactamase superfamily)
VGDNARESTAANREVAAMSETTGALTIDYLGHCAFRLTTPAGQRILVDPYRNWPDGRRWFKRECANVEADVLLVSHPHADHDRAASALGQPRLLDTEGELAGLDFRIRGLTGRHSARFGRDIDYFNTIFVLETAGLRVGLMGDNEADLSERLRDEIGPLDVLVVPVEDAGLILSAVEAERLAKRLQPRVVIPTHYFIEGLTEPSSGFAGIAEWRELQATVRELPGATLALRPEGLPETRQGWVFGNCLVREAE